mmetsp:Transcript_2016/g.4732  ORF Transcript_2016/g.4732 Transcript_2016/m.4732 type:complete len:92 (+) Transcript_2016:192-467(+)
MTAVDKFGRCDEYDDGITAIETIVLDGFYRCRHATRRSFNLVERIPEFKLKMIQLIFEAQLSSYCSNKTIFYSLLFPLVSFSFNVDSFYSC